MQEISRNKLLALNYLLLIANAATTFVKEAVQSHGLAIAALNLFDISAIIWLAVAACLALLWQSDDVVPPSRRDLGMTIGVAALALLPFPALSAASLTVMGVWGAVSEKKGSTLCRASFVVISISTFFLWGRLALALGSGPMLTADALFVSWAASLSSAGNIVTAVDGSKFAIAPGCSSLHGISLAFILWATVLAWFNKRITQKRLALLAAALCASIMVNGFRLALLGWNPQDFDYWHVGGGATIVGWLSLIVILAIMYFGMKNDRIKA